MNKSGTGKIIICVFSVIFGVLLLVMILVPQIIKISMRDERQGDFAEGTTKYSLGILEKEYGIEGFTRASNSWMADSKVYRNLGEKKQLSDYLVFCIFKSNKAAKKGYKEFREINFDSDSILYEDDYSVEGIITGVDDADIRLYVYRVKNMIIVCEASYDLSGNMAANDEIRKRYEKCIGYVRDAFK